MSNEPNALTNVVVSESNMETPVLVNDFATQELPAEKNLPVENISALTSANVLHAEIEPIKLDNLPLHQKHIMKRLEGIRESKQRILSALHKLKESATDEKPLDKKIMSRMIASCDTLSKQEEQYIDLMRKIVMIRENASEDIQLENEANEKSNDTININGSNIEVKNTDMATNRAPNEEVENDVQELNEELSKLGTVTSKAVAASIMNDKLLEAFQLHHQKKAALEELQRRNKETQKGVENQTLQEVQMARLKVASELKQVEKKRNELKRLHREALRRGIKLGPGSASEPDIVLEVQPEPKSITEAKLRAKLKAKQKQNAELENDSGPPVPEDLAPAERIPPILDGKHDNVGQQGQTAKGTNVGAGETSGKKKRKGKKKRGQHQKQLEEQSNMINSSIREKLAAIVARKERMREIRAQMAKPVVKPTSNMDETLHNALQQLRNITEIREQLELLHEKGDPLPEETAELLERQLEISEKGTQQDEINTPDVVTTEAQFEESIQAVEAVRSSFLEKVALKTKSAIDVNTHSGVIQDDVSVGYLSVEHNERLKNIEQALKEQQQLLKTIALQFQRRSGQNALTSSSFAVAVFKNSARSKAKAGKIQIAVRSGNEQTLL